MEHTHQLAHAVLQLAQQEEFGININIPVPDTALPTCQALNRTVCEVNTASISFDDTALIFPHVTLKMGVVERGRFGDVLQKVCAFSQTLAAFELAPDPVILKAPVGKYYFSEIEDERLLATSAALDELLREEMQPPRHPLSKANLHHITLGCKDPDDPQIAPIIGKMLPPFRADRIQISVLGERGVCLGVLKTCYLQGCNA